MSASFSLPGYDAWKLRSPYDDEGWGSWRDDCRDDEPEAEYYDRMEQERSQEEGFFEPLDFCEWLDAHPTLEGGIYAAELYAETVND